MYNFIRGIQSTFEFGVSFIRWLSVSSWSNRTTSRRWTNRKSKEDRVGGQDMTYHNHDIMLAPGALMPQWPNDYGAIKMKHLKNSCWKCRPRFAFDYCQFDSYYYAILFLSEICVVLTLTYIITFTSNLLLIVNDSQYYLHVWCLIVLTSFLFRCSTNRDHPMQSMRR